MAYIDPEGMFGGDRMAVLSDSAKWAFAWFWCASNTVGRVELNYSRFLRGPFRQFRKPPTEKQFWEWVTELHEAHLLFVYQVNGQAWGQWDTSERYLPAYKLKADERTPAPIAADFLAWRDEYQSSKAATLSSKCRLFTNSKNLRKSSEGSGKFSLGEERRGVGEEKEKTTTPADPPQQPPDDSPIQPLQVPVAAAAPPGSRKVRSTEEIRKALGPRLQWWNETWKVYPCHEGMNRGMDAYERRVRTRELAVEIYRGAERYAAKARADPTMKLKYFQGWINEERWRDEHVDLQRPAPRPEMTREQEMESLRWLLNNTGDEDNMKAEWRGRLQELEAAEVAR